jgi:hypothetical protein
METFFAMDVQRAAIQTMETVYIIATSKNLDTIRARYGFLLTVIPTLKSAKNNPDYSTLIQMALGQFKTAYPASVPQDYQLAILSSPDSFDIDEFYCLSLVNASKRFLEKQSEEINALKKEAAKTKRIAKVIETIKLAQSELQGKCSSASSYSAAAVELQRLASALNPSL